MSHGHLPAGKHASKSSDSVGFRDVAGWLRHFPFGLHLCLAAKQVANTAITMAFDTGPAQPSGDVKAVAPRGISEKGRSATYKKRGLWAIKKKHGGEFPKQDKQAKKDVEQPKVSGLRDHAEVNAAAPTSAAVPCSNFHAQHARLGLPPARMNLTHSFYDGSYCASTLCITCAGTQVLPCR